MRDIYTYNCTLLWKFFSEYVAQNLAVLTFVPAATLKTENSNEEEFSENERYR